MSRVDKIDVAVMKALRYNGRMTNLELACRLGLSPAPTLRRVKELEKHGFILGYRAELSISDIMLDAIFEGIISVTKRQDVADHFLNMSDDEQRQFIQQASTLRLLQSK